MSTHVMYYYEYKVFSSNQLMQFALKLARFCDIPKSDCYIFVHREEDGFETSTQSTLDELLNNLEIGTPPNSIGFHYNGHIITLGLRNKFNEISIMGMLNSDLDHSKKLIFFIENTLGLTRITQEVKNLQEPIDQSLKYVDPILPIDNESSIDQSSINVWNEIKLRLHSILPKVEYLTWIDALIPSMDGSTLTLYSPNEFSKIWLEKRYKTIIEETVQSFDPLIEEIIFKDIGKDSSKENGEIKYHLKLDKSLYELMKEVFKKETENATDEKAFDNYFNQIILSYCQEPIG